MDERIKAMHINLRGDQVTDYEVVREYLGITNDNDLVRYLFRQKAHEVRALEARLSETAAMQELRGALASEVSG